MGNHRRLAKNQNRLAKNTKWTSYVMTGVALEVVSLFGFAYVTDTHVLPPNLLATTIFVDGTKDVLPTSEPYDPTRMKNTLQSAYAQNGPDVFFDDGTVLQPGDQNVFIVYPRSLGILTGPTDPTYDDSEVEATRKILGAIEQARANGETEIYVVGYSQGAGAAAEALERLEDPSNIEQFVLIGNPRRNDGGLLARLPEGVYLPLVGASFGEGTTNPYPDDITVIQVTKQYDGVADSPKYIFNVLADANAALGFYYLHRDVYRNVELDYNGDDTVDQADFDEMEADGYATVTTSADGGVTDVLVLNPVGQLPLTRPLLDAGVPSEVVTALDPFLRAAIETGYDRPAPGEEYPSKTVHFQLLPPPSQAPTDLQAIVEGGSQTAELLAATVQSNQSNGVEVSGITAPPSAPSLSGLGLADSATRRGVTRTSDTARSVVGKGGAQSALNRDATDEPSETPPSRRSNTPEPSVRRPNVGWKPSSVVRSVLGTVNRSPATGGTTARDGSTAVSGSATSSSSPGSGSSTGSSNRTGSSKRTGSSNQSGSASGASQ